MSMKFTAMFVILCMIVSGTATTLLLQNHGEEQEFASFEDALERFNSFEEMNEFLEIKRNYSGGGYYYDGDIMMLTSLTSTTFDVASMDASPGYRPANEDIDYSTTNIQEDDVDEGDIVKNDDEYAYVISHNRSKVFVVHVYPPEEASILTELEFNYSIKELYLHEDKLVVLGSSLHRYYNYNYNPDIQISVYDITNKENPELTRNLTVKGSCTTSRIIGNYFYLIGNQYVRNLENESALPVPANEIFYVDEYDNSYSLTTIMSFDIQDNQAPPEKKVILMGASNNIYVSLEKIFITATKRMSYVEMEEIKIDTVYKEILPGKVLFDIEEVKTSTIPRWEKVNEVNGIIRDYTQNLTDYEEDRYYDEVEQRYYRYQNIIADRSERTIIHKIAIDEGQISYIANGEVAGRVLNRYSMDEHDGYFRIATTKGHVSRSGESSAENMVFVLGDLLNEVGKIENIAPGERIYSARFMGDRGYLVTFKKVDPFFVVDLSKPSEPRILGELKIPGYSNYLHPYDENHVIGIGKDCVDMGDFAWYQGVKVSLFDVTDVHNPTEISNFIIGDRGTESLALRDPHAFLFSKEKDLLVIPISLAEIQGSSTSPSMSGTRVWNGAYVLDISLDSDISLRGRITHENDINQTHRYYYSSPSQIKRSFYIGDVLYTVSGEMIKANDLNNLDEINVIELSG